MGTLGDMGRGSAATARRRDGFVVLPRHLAGPEREVARAGLAAMYLTAEDSHADPAGGRNGV